MNIVSRQITIRIAADEASKSLHRFSILLKASGNAPLILADRLRGHLNTALMIVSTLGFCACANQAKPGLDRPQTTCPRDSAQAGQMLVVDVVKGKDARASLTGFVNFDGAPIQGASVVVTKIGQEQPGQELNRATDGQGAFSIDLEPNIKYELVVYHDGFVPAYLHRIQAGSGDEVRTMTCMKKVPVVGNP